MRDHVLKISVGRPFMNPSAALVLEKASGVHSPDSSRSITVLACLLVRTPSAAAAHHFVHFVDKRACASHVVC